MKFIKVFLSVLFMAILVIPILFFNLEVDAISEIDNRKLTENPFSADRDPTKDFTNQIENFVNDRIGFRDEMITAYTILNDRIFSKMVHPSYVYGKNGYVFGAGRTTQRNTATDFHTDFADMVFEIQTYCEERDIPFVFVFEPAKPAILENYLADGFNYSRQWVDDFLNMLDERNINYVDNTKILKKKTSEGEVVFNQKYDANHWNDLGAFYGVNALLENLHEQNPNVHINSLDEFSLGTETMTTLPVSKFPINEQVPKFTFKSTSPQSITSSYAGEVELHPSYRGFGHFINDAETVKNTPRALVFQGSYMNGFGYKYLANSFAEYIHIHDYQNVLNFEYYFNIFQPECVVFEVAEYTFSNTYFDHEKMKTFKLQPMAETALADAETVYEDVLDYTSLKIEQGEALTKITWNTTEPVQYAWLILGSEFDFIKTDSGYTATVKNEVYNEFASKIRIQTFKNNILTIYN